MDKKPSSRCGQRPANPAHTALTDIKGGSHIPAAYDYPGAPYQTKSMLPGEIITFSLLFSVPHDTVLKDLVFSPRNNGRQKNVSDTRTTKSLPRYRRAEAGPPLVLQGRDLALMEDVWRYRLLSTSQLKTLRE